MKVKVKIDDETIVSPKIDANYQSNAAPVALKEHEENEISTYFKKELNHNFKNLCEEKEVAEDQINVSFESTALTNHYDTLTM